MEFKETAYSVIEDDRLFNVTLIKQGNSRQDIVVSIIAVAGDARCK